MSDSQYMIAKRLIKAGKSPTPDLVADANTDLKTLLKIGPIAPIECTAESGSLDLKVQQGALQTFLRLAALVNLGSNLPFAA